MPTLLESVTRSIYNWPTLYACRTDVLHQYFCVIGNGMVWQDGMMIDSYGDSTDHERAIMLKDEDEEIANLVETLTRAGKLLVEDDFRIKCIARVNARRHNAEVIFRQANADLLAHLGWHFDTNGILTGDQIYNPARSIYPLSAFSAMAKVPDDVQPDWLAGVREMIIAVFQAPLTKSPRLTHSQAIEQQNRNVAFAAEVLDSLHQRFGSPVGTPISYMDWKTKIG